MRILIFTNFNSSSFPKYLKFNQSKIRSLRASAFKGMFYFFSYDLRLCTTELAILNLSCNEFEKYSHSFQLKLMNTFIYLFLFSCYPSQTFCLQELMSPSNFRKLCYLYFIPELCQIYSPRH